MPDLVESMFYVGDKPWHGKGIQLENPPTIKEALVSAGLDWEVKKAPTYFHEDHKIDGESYDHGMVFEQQTGYYATYRTDTKEPLGNVSERYEVMQNEDAFAPFEPMIDWGFTLETAGSIKQGKKIWILAKSPEDYLVGDDKIHRYVFLYTSHDGSSGNCFRDTGVRIVCNNTLSFAISSKMTFSYQIRHTASMKTKMDDLKDSLVQSKGNFKKAIDALNRFKEYEMNMKQLDKYLETSIPFLKNRDKVSHPDIPTRNFAKPAYEKMVELFRTGRGNRGKTLWDAYNSVTDYYDHEKQYSDWVNSTQFGAAYDYKVAAFKTGINMVYAEKPVIQA